MNDLKISVLPLDIAWGDIEENVFATERQLRKIEKGTDIVVLPELFNTGFITSPEMLRVMAEDASDSATMSSLRRWAKKYNFAIVGTMLVKDGNNIFNRGFFVEPSGETTYYDKKHLFCMSAESTTLTPGSEPIPVVRYRGWNIALAICYEVRFPVWLRNTDNRYDILIFPANWPESRSYAWKHLLIARAIENQAYVVGVNRLGKDDGGSYDGSSYIIDYKGRIEASAGLPDAKCISAVLNRERLLHYRSSFPVIRDADNFKLV
ncbi:MAG: nitrilase family protein [Muribaculaceae bacterium]|nr:nitrilase family protein [Muribaculaceae bacterium]